MEINLYIVYATHVTMANLVQVLDVHVSLDVGRLRPFVPFYRGGLSPAVDLMMLCYGYNLPFVSSIFYIYPHIIDAKVQLFDGYIISPYVTFIWSITMIVFLQRYHTTNEVTGVCQFV